MVKQKVILEMANNHMGDVNHGIHMIDEFAKIIKVTDSFEFIWKFQFRNLDTFIHPDFKNKTDHKYVKRFSETDLSVKDLIKLKNYAQKNGFKTLATAFDEESVTLLEEMMFDMIKIMEAIVTMKVKASVNHIIM